MSWMSLLGYIVMGGIVSFVVLVLFATLWMNDKNR